MKIYNWKRFWCLRGGRIDISDGGFLYDPESEYSYFHSQDVKAFEELVSIPCLVLLGEPGIGKTSELKKAAITNKNILGLNDNQIYYEELNQYSDESRFISNVFNSINLLEARKNNSPYLLFLDSLDECKIRIDTISEILAKELKRNYWPNLFFRITCRTAEWSNYLENSLNEIYTEQNLKFYELTPLRRKDVILTLKENNIDEQKFFEEIYLKGVQPLTIKPITLNFITNLFIKNKMLPPSRKEIYEEGLKLLIDESNISRKESKLLKKYSSAHKLMAAQRIAAIMMLCNKSSICLIKDIQNPIETDVSLEDIYGKETIGNEEAEISEDLVKETLNTGLFVLHNVDKLGWFHQTFAEFLTARYLYLKELSDIQLINLLFQNFNGEVKSVPQLNETIGWIVTFRPDLFKKIIDTDIEVLLSSDVTLQEDANKEKLVEHLLRLFEENKIFDLNYSFKQNYHKLNHSNIESQLRVIINDKSKNNSVRKEAIDIAESCGVRTLLKDIWEVFSAKNESIRIRNNAGWALKNMADEEYIRKMKTVLLSDLSDDIEDELKGICLTALWPHFISFEELFSVLTKRKKPNLHGNYADFLYNIHFVNHNIKDLLLALQWVSKQDTKHNLDLHGITDIMNEIMFAAFSHIGNDDVLEAYKNAVIHLVKNHDDIVNDKLADQFYKLYETENFKRRRLIKAIFNSMSEPLKQIELFYFPGKHLAFSKDFQWMLEQSNMETEENKKRAWVVLAQYYFDSFNVENIDILITFSTDSVIYEAFKYYLKTIELNSEEAKKEKENYDKYSRPKNWEEKKNLYKLGYRENLFKSMSKLKEGECEILWQLFLLLVADPEKQSHYIEDNPNILEYPGWKILSNEEKALIISSSKEYLFKQDPHNSDWFGKYINYRPAKAGYKIIRMLFVSEIDFINNLSIEILKIWAPIIISFPDFGGIEDDDYSQKIVKFFYERIPDEILKLLTQLIEIETKNDEFILTTKKFEYCWDDAINKILYEKIIDEELPPNCYSSLLTDLLERNYHPAIEFLINKLILPLPEDQAKYQKIRIGCKLLLYYCFREAWISIWQMINVNETFGKELFLTVANERVAKRNFLNDMSESELSELFIWLEEKFPDETIKEPEDGHFAPLGEVKYFKNYIIKALKQRGNTEALVSIEKMKLRLTKLEWLNYVLYEAKMITRHKKWIALRPTELLKLLENKNLRALRDENDLVAVIIESLNKLEVEMHGITPTVKFIWNSKPVTPKSEKGLSDFIKVHLQRDLQRTIVNREVEIRSPFGKEVKGENTDLLVQTFINKDNDLVSVIIEVKGSWNKNLNTDMENQLIKRYLKDNQTRHGIYLVGWFLCDSWDKKDYKLAANPKIEIDDAKIFFNEQARALSKDGYYVNSFVLDCRL